MSVREELQKKGYQVGNFLLRTSKEEMEVWVEGGIPEGENWEELKRQMEDLGITGILERPEVREDGRVIVARGTPPVPGEDARLELLVDLSHGPREVDKHRVNFREMNLVVSVRAGTPVVKKIPPRPGQPGHNIWGEIISPPPVKDVDLIPGEGFRLDQENQVLIAERSGCVVEKQGRLSIEPTYTLEGDVDWESGNIRFFGEKLTISGGVKRGFRVEAEGEVEIGGGVEDAARIVVQGNLTIRGLIHGEKAYIECSGDAVLHSVEYATIKVGGNLTVRDYLLQARVKVGRNLTVVEGRGLVAAGEIQVGEEATVKVAGNDSFVPTVFRIGAPPDLYEEIEHLRGELSLLDETTEKLRKAVALGLKLKKEGKLTPEKLKILAKLQKVYGEKLRAQAEAQERLREKEEALKAYGEYTFKILERAFPGVRVFIGRHEHQVKELLQGPGEFYLEEGQVKFRPLSQEEAS
ncbi:DUF342 domain-containing protein [Thermosulfurimonas marina]|uniref:DUF342 domain-containing protein n=1 Tax=Thermosulfurimonas marina TaxID=2047767 RepID=A0A6H1WSA1_9BACT|nr:FapA family protein [Thermosulfurimonas marina]QJA06073.1 DUF342 domain-containing protein [Thermosulfurimonas marina]